VFVVQSSEAELVVECSHPPIIALYEEEEEAVASGGGGGGAQIKLSVNPCIV
jgi:hypothetical protein